MPGIAAVGTNTAINTSVVATSAPPTSSIARRVASAGGHPSSINRSTFSTTTIASSTTMPIANTNPNSDRLFREKPMPYMIANVPINDTGIATTGMIVARQFWRNTNTVRMTNSPACQSVVNTSPIDSSTNAVGL